MVLDRESRIAARRARIAARLKAAKSAQAPDSEAEGVIEENQSGFAKSQDFAPTLLKAQLKGKVLNLKSNANVRNFDDVSANISRYQDLENYKAKESEFCQGVAETTKCREALRVLNVPQELAKKITALCEAYESMVESKEKIIGEIYKELEVKDEEYSLNIKEQAKDVKDLISLMGQQVQVLRDFYLKELAELEAKLISQRRTLLDSNKAEMTSLIQERQDVEVQYHDELQACKEEYERLLNDIREEDIEAYNALKIKLEKDAQNLEQHLQNMRAVYQLNVEKLEYNFLVLTEREKENYIMSNQQKKKLTKQRDALSNIRNKHKELEKQVTDQNERLTDDYTRVNKLLLDLQRKQQSLQLIHTSIHHRFFFMHQHAISSLVSSVLQADKKIHEEELGWWWRLPSTSFFCMLGCSKPVKEQGASRPIQENRLEEDNRSVFDSLADDCYQRFMAALIYEAGFLIDDEAARLLADVNPELLERAQCVVILNALGVQTSNDLKKIYTLLTDRKDEDDVIVAVSQLKSYVHGEKILKEHIVSQAEQIAKQESNNYPFKLGPVRAKALALKLKWDAYWGSFTLVISPQVLRVWRHLESALVNYNQILKDRYATCPCESPAYS